ncbi:D-aminoacyl-tRNA deacylase [Nitrosophilus kaiyonis]|uniref:D-aminoacyl-tRNA deacylase n=1 Tax=Nitrosophilus kaiyonis TaxID=2930200 RepID=UPI002491F50B|nr:D-aminoacyl-tRNA deacylase [Nitrosophilus kaiyonis]
MIALLQKVKKSSVKVDERVVNKIGQGINILLGVFKDDSQIDIEKLVKKIVNLRIFSDNEGKMNLSIKDINGEILVISQFTLAGNVKKGRRPSFENAMEPNRAEELYEKFCDELSKEVTVKKGIFGAMMEVEIINDGPVTFIVDSKKL